MSKESVMRLCAYVSWGKTQGADVLIDLLDKFVRLGIKYKVERLEPDRVTQEERRVYIVGDESARAYLRYLRDCAYVKDGRAKDVALYEAYELQYRFGLNEIDSHVTDRWLDSVEGMGYDVKFIRDTLMPAV